MKVPERQTRWQTILSFRVCKCGHFNGIIRRSAQKTRNMDSKLILCSATELKRGLCCLNISKRSFNDICELAAIVVNYSGRIIFALYYKQIIARDVRNIWK